MIRVSKRLRTLDSRTASTITLSQIRKMTLSTIAQFSQQTQSPNFYDYLVPVIDPANNTVKQFSAYFYCEPTEQDWNELLEGWYKLGFKLESEPTLVRAIFA